MARTVRTNLLVQVLVASVVALPLVAQTITPDNYLNYLPPRDRLVSQTRASKSLHLYGDPQSASFVDASPVDGVDDKRATRLLLLAEHLSPIMRPNNFVVPRDWASYSGGQPQLVADSWFNERRVRSDTMAISSGVGVSHVFAADHGGSPIRLQSAETLARASDILLGQLVETAGPRSATASVKPAEGDTERVLFVDFPGSDRESWRAAHKDRDPRHGSHVFAHPFVQELSDAIGEARYQLAVQFWFFYPFNDAVNAHEGDWEHITVVATTRARARDAGDARGALLTATNIERVLSDGFPVDSVVISEVSYYFHQAVVTLDYLALSQPHSKSRRGAPGEGHYVWEDRGFMRDVVHKRLTVAQGKLATHPIVFIGGDNKGPDELLSLWPRFGGSLKRNSGASFPFPGTWQTIAGFGVTEQVHGSVVPAIRADTSLAWYDVIADDRYLHFRSPDITLVPDWECFSDLLTTNAQVRRNWAWLVLPIYWGFPVSRSPGGGLLMHADVGNIAPMGPAFQFLWNRVAAVPEKDEYRVRVLRTPVSPTTPWAVLRNGWGILNAPLALWGLMPGYNVALIELMPWIAGSMNILGSPPQRTFSPDRLPNRFTTEGQGFFREFGGGDFAGLLARPDSSATATVSRGERHSDVGPRFWFNLHFGEHFSFENTYSWLASDIRYDTKRAGGATSVVSGTLQMRQLTGGIRYDLVPLLDRHVQLYGRAGYGWLSYRAANERIDGAALGNAAVSRGYLPPFLPSRHWIPNAWYGGAGLEAFSPRRYWLFGLLGYGLRVEYSEYLHRLSFGAASARGDVTTRRHDIATSLVFGW